MALVNPRPGIERGRVRVIAAAPWAAMPADARQRVGADAVVRLAALFGKQGLHRVKGILDFAREYGAIGRPEEYLVETRTEDGKPTRRYILAEPYGDWVEAIRKMAWLCAGLSELGVIERVDESEDDHLLAGLITARALMRERELEPAPPPELTGTLGPRGRKFMLDWIADCQARGFAPLREQIVRRLHQAIEKDRPRRPRPLRKPSNAEARAMQIAEVLRSVNAALWRVTEHEPEVRYTVSGAGFPLRGELEPRTLRAALALQVVKMLEAASPESPATRYQKCARPACDRFVVHTGDLQTGRRADAAVCSQRCAQDLYRKRKRKAREMHASGASIDEIVVALNVREHKGNTPYEIVNGWLESHREDANGEA